MSNACRHFRQKDLFLRNGGCALGHPIVKIIESKTSGPMVKVFKRLCCKGNGTDLINCPNADFKTDAEIEADRAEMKAAMDRVIVALPKLQLIKKMMISDNENHRRTDCPFCGAADSMEVFVHIRGNKHMQAKCAACGDGIIE